MERKQQHIDEGTLHAWLDGALPPDESARVEAHVASCASCGEAAAEARGLIAASSRILTALDGVPGGVLPAMTVRRRWTGWPLRAAAAIIFVAAGSFAVVRQLGDVQPERAVAKPLVSPPAPVPTAEQARENQPTVTPPRVAPLATKKQHPVAARKRDVEKVAPAPQQTAPAAAQAPVAAPAPLADQAPVVHDDSSPVAARVDNAARPVLIAGKVVSAKTGEPVASAQVHLSNPPVNAATNANGDYTIPVPAALANGQPTQLSVRRIGYESKLDSVTIARSAAADTVHHDVALKEATMTLEQQVITGAGVQGFSGKRSATPSAPGCYAITLPGLPARIEIGDRLRVMPPDSAAFPTAYWTPDGTTRVRIVLGDTAGTMHEIKATIAGRGLLGSVTRSDSTSVVTPFSAIRTATRCP